jgi:putative SOS response-associated peptidase YedK
LTTAANDLMKPLHDRMPVVLSPGDFAVWLDPAQEPGKLTPLLVPYRDDDLTAYAVATLVNSPRNDNGRCIEPVASGWQAGASKQAEEEGKGE